MRSKISGSIFRVFMILLLLVIGIMPLAVAQTMFNKSISQDAYPPQTAYLKTSSLETTNNLLESPAPDENLEEKLNKLREYVDSIMKDAKVPGLAMGIIKNGEVIFAEGFGYRNLEEKLPVTTKTLFVIASCTKAFTTAAIGMLVDEGKVGWNKPVRTYLPSFQLKDEYITRNITVRDLVTHRSGLPRHDGLWYGSYFTRKEMFDRLRYLDLSAGFRERYQYNNLMFMTAGYLVGQVTKSTWEEFVKERIFKPLFMTNSNFSVEVSKKSDDFALPYLIKDEEVKRIPFRNLDEIGPAGSINSCVDDMLKWIQFHFNKGKAGETRLISESEIQSMHTPYMHISSPMELNEQSHNNYGLGWMILMYRGHKLVRHGGGIDGFTTSTSFMPFDSIGVFVVNNGRSSISSFASTYAIDLLLDLEPIDRYAKMKEAQEKAKETEEKKKKEERVEGTKPSHQLKEYVGQYEHPAYGIIAIEFSGDSLSGKFKSFDFTLEHWHYDVFKNTKVFGFGDYEISFSSNKNGDIEKFAIQLEPMVDDIVFSRKPSEKLSDPMYLEQFTGEYKIGEMIIKVELRNDGVLIAKLTGKPIIELEPYKENEFNCKGIHGLSAKFTVEKERAIEMIVHELDYIFTAKRVE